MHSNLLKFDPRKEESMNTKKELPIQILFLQQKLHEIQIHQYHLMLNRIDQVILQLHMQVFKMKKKKDYFF